MLQLSDFSARPVAVVLAIIGAVQMRACSVPRADLKLSNTLPKSDSTVTTPTRENAVKSSPQDLCASDTNPGTARSDHIGVSANAAGLYDSSRMGRALDVLSGTRVGWIRIPLSWDRIEKEPGKMDWGESDALIRSIRARGFKLLVYVAHTPAWASSAPAALPVPRRRFFPPTDPKRWETFLREAAERYRADVSAWEVWNEPSFGFDTRCDRGSWCAKPADYASLLAQSKQVLQGVDPGATVLIGGLVLGGRALTQDFVGTILQDRLHPSGPLFDVMNIHSYGQPTLIAERANIARRGLARRSLTKPLWLTETGTSSDPSFAISPQYAGAAGQARYLCDAFNAARNTGADKVFWFKLFDSPSNAETPMGQAAENREMGLLDSNLRPKPAFDAIRRAASRW